MEGETLLYNTETRKFCRLNETAAFLWERLAEPRSLEQLASDLCAEFAGVELQQARRDVQGALEELVGLSVVVQE